MIQNITNIKITHKILILTSLLIIAIASGISFGVYHTVHGSMIEDVAEAQTKNVGIAATILAREFPGTDVTFSEEDGALERVEMLVIPSFTDHEIIDEIANLTGETATVFSWSDRKNDYVRVTTNIEKEGQRVIGTTVPDTVG